MSNKTLHISSVNCKTIQSVKSINDSCTSYFGNLEEVIIQFDFQPLKKGLIQPSLELIRTICNYFLACFVIDQLQTLVPIAFRKSHYRGVRWKKKK